MLAAGQPDSTRESGESRRREAERGTNPQAPAADPAKFPQKCASPNYVP